MRSLIRPTLVISVVLLGGVAVAGGPSKAKPLPAKSLVALYEHWLERPYEYMFDRSAKALTVGQNSYGQYLGGINGILKYGSLIDAAAKLLQLAKPSFGDLRPIEKLAALAIYVKEDSSGRTFSHFNPALVRWGYANLIPKPEAKILGHSCRTIYDKVFSRYFRLMTESYLYLERGKRWDKETAAYAKAIKTKRGGIPYLERRYAGLLSQYSVSRNGTNFTPPMAIGFWVRRKMDSTAADLWAGLSRLMKVYDGAFLAKAEKGG
jgi:hypothetical protein